MSDLPQQDIYEFNERRDVQPFLPTGVRSALDVGCGAGGFGATLRSTYGAEARLVGVEAVASQAASASTAGYDEVVQGYFPAALEDRDERFDLICFNDVLEHVIDPWTTLGSCHRHLTPGGRVLATIPSIQFAPVLWKAWRGRWDYADEGTLDRTHVRFFTRATMVEMFEQAGFSVETCVGANSLADTWRTDPNLVRRGLKLGLARALGPAQYLHFVLVGRAERVAS